MYIPSSIGEISDQIGAMVLCMPDMELPNSGLGFEGAYAQIEESFGIVRTKLGEDKYLALIDMARKSRNLFAVGSNKEGRKVLMEMKKQLNWRGSKRALGE